MSRADHSPAPSPRDEVNALPEPDEESQNLAAAQEPLSLVVKKRRRENNMIFEVERMRLGLGWVITWLRKRTGRSAAWVAHRIHRGPQTVRDVEKGTFEDFGWSNAYLICRCLKYQMSRVEELTWRYLIHDYKHQKRLHKKEPKWAYHPPWSEERGEERSKEDAKLYIRKHKPQNHARHTGLA
jgi:hypothetical protein